MSDAVARLLTHLCSDIESAVLGAGCVREIIYRALDGPAGLRAALLERRESFVAVATSKLLTYALGRAVEHYDMPAVRRIVDAAAADKYRFSALILGIVESVPFRYKVKAPLVDVTAREGQ